MTSPPMPPTPPALMAPELRSIMSNVEVAELVGVASISIRTPLESMPPAMRAAENDLSALEIKREAHCGLKLYEIYAFNS